MRTAFINSRHVYVFMESPNLIHYFPSDSWHGYPITSPCIAASLKEDDERRAEGKISCLEEMLVDKYRSMKNKGNA